MQVEGGFPAQSNAALTAERFRHSLVVRPGSVDFLNVCQLAGARQLILLVRRKARLVGPNEGSLRVGQTQVAIIPWPIQIEICQCELDV
jgi:hypothetical protein